MLNRTLIDGLTKKVLVPNLYVTESSIERMKGLLGWKKLAYPDGLLITSCNSVHTFFMPYTIDVIYLNKQGVIIKIVNGLKPWRLSFCLKASSTLELADKLAKQLGFKKGQLLKNIQETKDTMKQVNIGEVDNK